MDDDSGGQIGPGGEEDLSLPKATMAKLIQELLPADVGIAKETRDLLTECCVEFIHLVSSEASEVCDKEKKKTIGGEQVIQAFKNLGFQSYIPEIEQVMLEHKSISKDREVRKSIKQDNGYLVLITGMTEEEMIRSQEALFAKARERLAMQQQSTIPSADNVATE